MAEPDFSKYTEAQLRQILTRIDAARFPDRVAQIHARLAELQAESPTRPEADRPPGLDGAPEIAGFWRRAGAFLLDALLLGLVGLCLGLFLREQFEAMGQWGRAVGFFVALAYFSVMESEIFQGQTLGKRLLDIKVVARTGVAPGFAKSLLRSAVFNIPYFLNGVDLGAGYTAVVLPAVGAILVFGLGGAIVYLCLFNRRTRQSVHDIAAGAVVVRAGLAGAPRLLPVWRGHFVAVLAFFALAAGGVAYIHARFDSGALEPLARVQQQVSRLPGIRSATVMSGAAFATGHSRTDYLLIKAVSRTQVEDEKALAIKIAGIALDTYPPAQRVDSFSVLIIHGYDIGIANSWHWQAFNGTPGDWRQGLVGSARTPD